MIHAEITFDGMCKGCKQAKLSVEESRLYSHGIVVGYAAKVHCQNEAICTEIAERIKKEADI